MMFDICARDKPLETFRTEQKRTKVLEEDTKVLEEEWTGAFRKPKSSFHRP
jgi:hypothetical protein